jgi:predicted TIM-barrel fold metal-dependent hydrolase
MIIDTHAHFWEWPDDPEAQRAARLYAASQPGAHAHGPFGVDAALAEMNAAGVERMLQVTPTMMGYDNRASFNGARDFPSRFRVIGRFDPTSPDLEDRLDEALETGMLVGVRVNQFPLYGPWLVDGSLDRLWRALAARGLPASLYAPNRHEDVARVAARNDGLSLIVDHAAVNVLAETPLERRLAGWDLLEVLAKRSNVTVKISGLLEATDGVPPFDAARALLGELINCFGSSRLMWASNFPPSGRVASYVETLDFTRTGTGLSSDDLSWLLNRTARSVFRVNWWDETQQPVSEDSA